VVPLVLEHEAPVEAVVYDMLGRRVAVLASGVLAAGRHALRVEPGRLAPGRYVVRVVAQPAGKEAVVALRSFMLMR
jgi:hypothetical protein